MVCWAQSSGSRRVQRRSCVARRRRTKGWDSLFFRVGSPPEARHAGGPKPPGRGGAGGGP